MANEIPNCWIILIEKKRGKYVKHVKTSGVLHQIGSTQTVVIFDRAFVGEKFQFVGGKEGIRPESTTTFVHELAHVIGDKRDILKAFRAFLKKHKIAKKHKLKREAGQLARVLGDTPLAEKANALVKKLK